MRGFTGRDLLGTLLPLLLLWSGTPAFAGTIGLVPDPDPGVEEDLARGARLAVEWIGGDVELVVAEAPRTWSDAAAAVNALIDDAGADVLLAPPDRATAHLVAQLATRRHVPAVATAGRGSDVAGSISAAGSWWMVVCTAPPETPAALGRALGRPPREAETAAWTAVLAAREILRAADSEGEHPGAAWRSALPPSCREASGDTERESPS